MNYQLRMAARVGLAPTPNGSTGRRATLTPPGNRQLALPAGLPPASFRLEGGCLMYSTTAAFEIGQRGRICTCDPSVPGRVRWLLRYALMALTSVSSGQEKRRTPTLARSCGKLVEKIGGPEGGCTLNRPADNGVLS